MTDPAWFRSEVLGDYGWCVATVWVDEECLPPCVGLRFESQACSVSVTALMHTAETIEAANRIEQAARGVYVEMSELEDNDVPFLWMSTQPYSGGFAITFHAHYGIAGTIPFTDHPTGVEKVVAMLRDAAAQLPEDE